mgnify:CR=1 FL=1
MHTCADRPGCFSHAPPILAPRHSALLSALERTQAEATASCCAAGRKLAARVEAARKAASERQDALAAAQEREAAVVEALTHGLGLCGGVSPDAVRAAVAAAAAVAARRAAGDKLDAHAKERAREEEARWQVGRG